MFIVLSTKQNKKGENIGTKVAIYSSGIPVESNPLSENIQGYMLSKPREYPLAWSKLPSSRVVIFHYTVTYRQYGFTSVHDKRTSQWPLSFVLRATDMEVTARLTLNGLDDEIMQEPQNERRLCWAADQLGLYQGGELDRGSRAQLDTHTTPQVGSNQRLSMLSLISFSLA